jgi:hypothetical protein
LAPRVKATDTSRKRTRPPGNTFVSAFAFRTISLEPEPDDEEDGEEDEEEEEEEDEEEGEEVDCGGRELFETFVVSRDAPARDDDPLAIEG